MHIRLLLKLEHQRSNTGTSNSSNTSSSSSSINLSSQSNIQVPILRAFKWKDEDSKYSFEYFELFRKQHRASSTDTTMSDVSGVTSESSLKSLDGMSKEEAEEYMDENEKIEDVLRLEGACVYAVPCEDDLEDRVFCLRYFPVSCENAREVYFEVRGVRAQ